MKKLFSLILLAPMFMNAQEGIRFEEGLTWKQVLQKAKDENKYIFVDCYATWCGPCKWMDSNIYPNDTVGRYFNQKFVSVKVQMDTSKSDNAIIKSWYADASIIKGRYKVTAFPTYLFFSPNGDIVHRDISAKGVNFFMAIGADALNPDRQYYTTLEKYRRHELDTAYMKVLARQVKAIEGEELASKIANDYINRLPIDALFTQDNIRLMHEFTKRSKDRGFFILRDSAKRISETDDRVKESNCKAFVLNIMNEEEIKPFTTTKKGKPDWKKIKSNLKKYGLLGEEAFIKYKPGIIFKTEIEPALRTNSDWNHILALIEKQNLGANAEFIVGSTVVYYLNGLSAYHTEKNCKNLIAAATYYADSFSTVLTSRSLNIWAWTIFEHSTDKEELNKALAWSKRSVELQASSPEPEELDTYANILYKLGFVNEAISWEEKAVAAADAQAKKRNSTANPVFKKYLDKMKKGEKTWPER